MPDLTPERIAVIHGIVIGNTVTEEDYQATRDLVSALEQERKAHAEIKIQINQLANFIMFEVPGEPSRSEGAVECVIRIIGDEMKDRDEWKARAMKAEAARDEDGSHQDRLQERVRELEAAIDVSLEECDVSYLKNV